MDFEKYDDIFFSKFGWTWSFLGEKVENVKVYS